MPKPKKKKNVEVKPDEMQELPAGAVPHIVNQRVYEFLPVFYQALKTLHEDLEEIKEILKE